MNNDLISRGELNKAIETWDKFACLPDGKLYPTRELEHLEMFVHYIRFDDATTAIDNMPTAPLPDFKEGYKQAIIDGKANFSRQKGEWVNMKSDDLKISDYKCSCCGYWIDDNIFNFCPDCGADMRKGVKKDG